MHDHVTTGLTLQLLFGVQTSLRVANSYFSCWNLMDMQKCYFSFVAFSMCVGSLVVTKLQPLQRNSMLRIKARIYTCSLQLYIFIKLERDLSREMNPIRQKCRTACSCLHSMLVEMKFMDFSNINGITSFYFASTALYCTSPRFAIRKKNWQVPRISQCNRGWPGQFACTAGANFKHHFMVSTFIASLTQRPSHICSAKVVPLSCTLYAVLALLAMQGPQLLVRTSTVDRQNALQPISALYNMSRV